MASKDTEAVLKLMKDNDCDILDLKFIDVTKCIAYIEYMC